MTVTEDRLDAMYQNSPSDIDALAFETNYEVGQDSITPFGFHIHKPVFLISAGSFISLVAVALVNLEASANPFGWSLMVTVYVIFVFCLFIGLAKLGRVKIVGEDVVPEYGISR